MYVIYKRHSGTPFPYLFVKLNKSKMNLLPKERYGYGEIYFRLSNIGNH